MTSFIIENNKLSVKVNSFGAELSSVISKETQIEYLWQADKTVWARYAPNLFPIVGKLKNGEFSYQSKTYRLPQHGFARDQEFICIEQTENKVVFELTDNEDLLKNYPFQFRFKVIYTLVENGLTVQYSIFNPATEELYFSVGAHPAFNCPLQIDEKFEDYELLFSDKNTLTINALNDGLITSNNKEIKLEKNRLSVNKPLFEKDALVCLNNQINEVSLVSKKTQHGVTLKSENWPYFGIWSKPQTEQFVCLEPWYGIADSDNASGDLTKKNGIIKLQASEQFDCSFSIKLF
jgi:galactose mutarotase-like enzyme